MSNDSVGNYWDAIPIEFGLHKNHDLLLLAIILISFNEHEEGTHVPTFIGIFVKTEVDCSDIF